MEKKQAFWNNFHHSFADPIFPSKMYIDFLALLLETKKNNNKIKAQLPKIAPFLWLLVHMATHRRHIETEKESLLDNFQ